MYRWEKWDKQITTHRANLVYCMFLYAHKLKMFLKLLNGWKKLKRIILWQVKIIWNSDFSAHKWNFIGTSVQFSCAVCSTLCDPMNCSTPGLPVHHHLPEFTQTHVHRVSDVIQPSHPLSSPSLPALNPSQHQSFFQWVNSSHEVAKVLEFQL